MRAVEIALRRKIRPAAGLTVLAGLGLLTIDELVLAATNRDDRGSVSNTSAQGGAMLCRCLEVR